MSKYQATASNVIAEILKHEEVSAAGLALIRNEREDLPGRARVLSVGKKFIGMDKEGYTEEFQPPCKEGDIIYFKRYSPKSLEEMGKLGMTRGLVKIFWGDILGVEDEG